MLDNNQSACCKKAIINALKYMIILSHLKENTQWLAILKVTKMVSVTFFSTQYDVTDYQIKKLDVSYLFLKTVTIGLYFH